nr:uncharacterized protein LOC128677275 [Plodia interpunctella]
MQMQVVCLVVAITALAVLGDAELYKFSRSVLETGSMFYKLRLTLGNCVDSKIFTESKIWANVRMNRIFDIYYKSENPLILVSKVEVILIINNTDVSGRSERGVGFQDFSAFIILPIRAGFVIYTVNIYMCNTMKPLNNQENLENIVESPPFVDKMGNSDSEEAEDDEEENEKDEIDNT